MCPHFRSAAILLCLTSALSFCQAQDATGYGLPDFVVPAPKLIQRTYLVADLVVPMQGSKEQPGKPLHESLMKLLRNTIEPKTWDEVGGRGTIEYFPLGMTLVVNQTEEIQKAIAELLAELRKAQDVEIAVEVKIVHVPLECAETFDAQPKPAEGNQPKVKMLDEGQVKKLLDAVVQDRRANIMQAPKITMFNGQDSHLECVETQRFATGVNVRWNGEKMVSTPHHEAFETGCRINLQPVVPDQKTVRLHFQANLTSLEGEPNSVAVQTTVPTDEKVEATETHSIQTPRLTVVNVDRLLTIADGGTALLSGWIRQVNVKNECPFFSQFPYLKRLCTKPGTHEETECVLILVTPRIIVNDDKMVKQPVMPRAEGEEEACEPEPKSKEELRKEQEILEKATEFRRQAAPLKFERIKGGIE